MLAVLSLLTFCAGVCGLPALQLRTGVLQLSPSLSLSAARTGMLVATAEPSSVGDFGAALAALGEECVTVGGYLPPTSFLIHLVAEPCAAALAHVPGLASLTPLPGALRLSPDLLQAPVSPPAAATTTPPPVRMLTLALARPAAALLPALAAALAPLCSHCSATPWEASTVLVSALAGAGCPPWDAPEGAGCTLPPDTAATLAGLPYVAWVQAYTPPTARNIEGRGGLLTTDLFNWGGIARELGPACGQGFGTCSSASLVEAAGLNGAGQLVQVCDTGLDTGLPFFFDSSYPSVPRRRQIAPPASASRHRKVADYFAFADGVDGDGHGTHCAGSVSGNALPALAAAGVAATAEDSVVLPLLSGLAPLARLAVADIQCDTPTCTTIQPIGRNCTFGFCTPPYSTLFDAGYLLGARISSNSWGPSSSGFYTQVSVDIDTYAYTHPDALFVWAVDNTGNKGSQTIGDDAVSKNILSVGATLDGLPAHLLKTRGGIDLDGRAIPALFQPNSPYGCSAVLSAFNISGLLACPKQPLTDASCAATALSVFNLGDGAPTLPGGYSSGGLDNYGEMGNLEFVLCCGCSPQQVLQGLSPALRRDYADLFSQIYYSRIVGTFSSRGPTVDGRIKPDVAAPGVQIISARARAMDFLDCPYANFSCSAVPFAVTFAGAGGSFPAPSFQFATFSAAEPLYIDTVTVPFTSPTGKGYADLDVLDQDSFRPIVSLTRAFLKGAKAGTLTFAINHTFPAGFKGAIYVNWNEAPGANITLAAAGGSAVKRTPCFGSVASDRSITLNVRRGGGMAYAIEKTGTSMATPIVAGSAALVRQYFTGGFYSIPSGASTLAPAPATAGFSPSSALLKATLINSASSLLYNDICQLPGQDYNFCTENRFPRAQIQFWGGHGMPSLPRGLAFTSLGPATRATGALPSMVMPGLTQAPAPALPSGTLIDPALIYPSFVGVDPTQTNGRATVYCIDTQAPSSALVPVPTLPLSATLVWTDPPGSPLAAIALVNNLDLELTPPGGGAAATRFGNNNASVTPQVPDTLNNVEKLLLPNPVFTLSATGARLAAPYTVVVRGTRVPMGPQAYSLVITGPGVALAPSGTAGCGADPGAAAAAAPPSTTLVNSLAVGVGVLGIAVVALSLYLAALKGTLPCRKGGGGFASGGGASYGSSDSTISNPLAFNAVPAKPVMAWGESPRAAS